MLSLRCRRGPSRASRASCASCVSRASRASRVSRVSCVSRVSRVSRASCASVSCVRCTIAATPAVPAMSHRSVLVPLCFAIAACGGSSGPAPAPATPVVTATPRLTPDDVEVATVNGRTVWSSCVAAQAAASERAERGDGHARRSPDSEGAPERAPAQRRTDALDQCIAFELLAQAAEARGLAAAHEVGEATRAAAVDRLIETDFEQRYRTPADLGAIVDAVMKRNEWRLRVPEMRSSTFARFLVPGGAPPELDARARALAEQLAGQLAAERGLYGVHLAEAARRIATGDVKLETSDVRPMRRDDLVVPYGDALYAIPEVGRIGAVARTQWGWDVVLWTGGVEPHARSRDEVIAELFPELRRRQFQLWTTQLGKQLGLRIELARDAEAQLDTADTADNPDAPDRGEAP